MSTLRPEAFFSGPGLDRADSARGDPERLAEFAASPSARELVWNEGAPSIGSDGSLQWSALSSSELFLGLDSQTPCFSALQQEVASGPAVFSLIGTLSPAEAPLFAAALSLARWHSRHRFCANCGNSTDLVRGGWSRRCPACSAEHYPRVDPVVIMLAEHDGKLLLGRQYHYPPSRFSALAGFVEVGETFEDAVARELREESGIEVTDVTYVASQPWPFPSSLMIAAQRGRKMRPSPSIFRNWRMRAGSPATMLPQRSKGSTMPRSRLRRLMQSPELCSSTGSRLEVAGRAS